MKIHHLFNKMKLKYILRDTIMKSWKHAIIIGAWLIKCVWQNCCVLFIYVFIPRLGLWEGNIGVVNIVAIFTRVLFLMALFCVVRVHWNCLKLTEIVSNCLNVLKEIKINDFECVYMFLVIFRKFIFGPNFFWSMDLFLLWWWQVTSQKSSCQNGRDEFRFGFGRGFIVPHWERWVKK